MSPTQRERCGYHVDSGSTRAPAEGSDGETNAQMKLQAVRIIRGKVDAVRACGGAIALPLGTKGKTNQQDRYCKGGSTDSQERRMDLYKPDLVDFIGP